MHKDQLLEQIQHFDDPTTGYRSHGKNFCLRYSRCSENLHVLHYDIGDKNVVVWQKQAYVHHVYR